ncbi:MAG: S1-like domain-containing RNA-binding protein [Sphingobacteriales bacterium]|jgi:predicted RNA-binding protein (virulence factor B family)|nr:S1-like domain-containing RNA-binding protein [Sphingobacteriales bacterium]
MIEIGKKNTLRAIRNTPQGIYLVDKNNNEVLLPNKYVPKTLQAEELLEVFVYKDSEDRLIATTLVPLIEANSLAKLVVNEVNSFGAFLDMGIDKDLLVPIKEQLNPMKEGKSYWVYCYLDEVTQRLVGSSKIKRFLTNDKHNLVVGQEVDCLIFDDTPLGYLAVINNKQYGLIYHNEVYSNLRIGDTTQAFVKKIKDTGEIDLSLQKIGFTHVNDQTDVILNHLKKNGGFLNLNDDSAPEEIQARLKISKKVFKKAIGILYREKKITIEEQGIRLK